MVDASNLLGHNFSKTPHNFIHVFLHVSVTDTYLDVSTCLCWALSCTSQGKKLNILYMFIFVLTVQTNVKTNWDNSLHDGGLKPNTPYYFQSVRFQLLGYVRTLRRLPTHMRDMRELNLMFDFNRLRGFFVGCLKYLFRNNCFNVLVGFFVYHVHLPVLG